MTLQLLPIYCFNSSVGLFIVSTAMFSNIKWHCNDFICKWNVYTCEGVSICWWTILKMYSPHPPLCGIIFGWIGKTYFLYFSECVTSHYCQTPHPHPRNDVTNSCLLWKIFFNLRFLKMAIFWYGGVNISRNTHPINLEFSGNVPGI